MNIHTEFGYWVKVAPFTDFKIRSFGRPSFVGCIEVPKDLNALSIGQLISLSDLTDDVDSLYKIAEIVLGMSRSDIDKARAVDVVKCIGWIYSEVQKINKLFEKASNKPTSREKKAGIEKLQFGLFGMIDWYALRMGIQNHDDVLDVPWMRIYKCMDMDNKRQSYERKLQNIATSEINNR